MHAWFWVVIVNFVLTLCFVGDPLSIPSPRTHSLRVAVDTAQAVLGHTEEERDVLKYQVRDLQDNLVSLKRDNEKAREMRSLALEERSKVSLMFDVQRLCMILSPSSFHLHFHFPPFLPNRS